MDKYESLYLNSPVHEANTLYRSPDGLSGIKASSGALCLYDRYGAVYTEDTPQNRNMMLNSVFAVEKLEESSL